MMLLRPTLLVSVVLTGILLLNLSQTTTMTNFPNGRQGGCLIMEWVYSTGYYGIICLDLYSHTHHVKSRRRVPSLPSSFSKMYEYSVDRILITMN